MRSIAVALWASLACVFLAGCGGGGGGDGDSGSGSNNFVVKLSTSNIAFDFETGATPVPQTVTATWQGTPPPVVYIGAVVDGPAIDPQVQITITDTAATARIFPNTAIAGGEYSGQIYFLVCPDPACTSRIGGSPLPIAYTARVRAAVISPVPSLSFQYPFGAPLPPTQNVTTNAAAGAWTASATHPWITLASTSGSAGAPVVIGFDPAGLNEGSRLGHVTVSGANGSQRTIEVRSNVRVPAFVLSPEQLTFSSSVGVPTPDQTLSVALDNQAAAAWTASASLPWLVLNKTSGMTPDTVRVGISTTQPPTSGTYQGTITFSATLAGRAIQRSVNVAVTVERPFLTITESPAFQGTNGSPIADKQFRVQLSNGANVPLLLTADRPWIRVRNPTPTTATTFGIGIDNVQPVNSGSFTGTLTASTVINGETLSRSFEVSLDVTDPALILSSNRRSFSGVNGAAISAQSITVRVANNAPISLQLIGDQPWLSLTDTSTTGAASFSIAVDPSQGPLASGLHDGTVTVNARLNGAVISLPVDVSLSLSRPTLTISHASVVLGNDDGRDASPRSISVSLNTGARTFAWNVTNVPAWLDLDRTSGSIGSTPQPVSLTPDRLQSTPGTASASLTFASVVNGDTVTATLPVEFNLDAHRLIASEVGVAFTSAGGWARLSRIVSVRDNFGLPGTWSAVSNQPWLTVTASGPHGGDLQLVANPAALSSEQVHEATITLTSSDSSIVSPERIRVGLWITSASPGSVITLNGDHKFIAADPVRPYVYTHGDAGASIRVINVYNGAQVNTLTLPVTALGPMTVSADGTRLFVLDLDTPTMLMVDLVTGTPSGSYPAPINGRALVRLGRLRTNGVEILAAGGSTHVHALTGIPVNRNGAMMGEATGDGRYLFGGSARFTLDYTAANGGRLLSAVDGSAPPNVPEGFFASPNVDGSRSVYTSHTVGPCRLMDGIALTDLGALGVGAGSGIGAAMSVNDFALCAMRHQFAPSSADNFWVYDVAGTLRTSLRLSSSTSSRITDYAALFSGDGFMSMVATESVNFNGTTYPGVALHLIPVGP